MTVDNIDEIHKLVIANVRELVPNHLKTKTAIQRRAKRMSTLKQPMSDRYLTKDGYSDHNKHEG